MLTRKLKCQTCGQPQVIESNSSSFTCYTCFSENSELVAFENTLLKTAANPKESEKITPKSQIKIKKEKVYKCDLCYSELKQELQKLENLFICKKCFSGQKNDFSHRKFIIYGPQKIKSYTLSKIIKTFVLHFPVEDYEITGIFESKLDLDLELSRESLLNKSKKLFSNEIQVGDSLFDDFVYIDSQANETTINFLKSPEIQGAILYILNEAKTLKIKNNILTVFYEIKTMGLDGDSKEIPNIPILKRSMSVLLHFLELAT